MFDTCAVTGEAVFSHYYVTGFAAGNEAGVVACLCGCAVSLACTSKSLRLCGCLNATMGGSGMAALSLSETWRMFRCFLSVLAILERCLSFFIQLACYLLSGR